MYNLKRKEKSVVLVTSLKNNKNNFYPVVWFSIPLSFIIFNLIFIIVFKNSENLFDLLYEDIFYLLQLPIDYL